MSKHTSPAVDASSAGSVQNDFSKGSVGAAVFRMAVPITLAQLVNVAYNLVDRMYIGRIPGAGALALTGLGLCLPVISLVTAFSRLCGAGGAPLCSIERGRGDLDQAERIMGNSFALLLIFESCFCPPSYMPSEPVPRPSPMPGTMHAFICWGPSRC